MAKVAIFGTGQRAREIRFLLNAERDLLTDMFIVDEQYLSVRNIDGCEVISTEHFLNSFNPSEVSVFLGVGMPKINKVREKLYELFHAYGFAFSSFISKNANVYTTDIGEGTTVFAGVNIGPRVKIGKCNHFEMGVTISHDCQIGDYNFFAPGCTLCGDISIGRGNFIGANSTIRNSVKIGDNVLIGAGAYADRDISDSKVIVPARSIELADKTSEWFMK